jgi:hypothetical protein
MPDAADIRYSPFGGRDVAVKSRFAIGNSMFFGTDSRLPDCGVGGSLLAAERNPTGVTP